MSVPALPILDGLDELAKLGSLLASVGMVGRCRDDEEEESLASNTCLMLVQLSVSRSFLVQSLVSHTMDDPSSSVARCNIPCLTPAMVLSVVLRATCLLMGTASTVPVVLLASCS